MVRHRRDLSSILECSIEDIFFFCSQLNFEPTEQQAEALGQVQIERSLPIDERLKKIAVKSGQGTGKTTVSVIIGLWCVLQEVDSLVIVTAPTMRQCKDVWISELRRLMFGAARWLQKMVKIDQTRVTIAKSKNWQIRCVTATQPQNMQGIHQTNLTFIMEEASGISRDIWETIKGTVSNKNSLIFAIGNPNSRGCEFFGCFNQQRHQWRTLTFNAEDSPLVSKQNIKALGDEYGVNSDVYRVRVLGEFPTTDPKCVISAEDLEACTKTDPYVCMRLGLSAKAFGIDLARFGSHESVIYRRSGYAVVEFDHFAKTDPSVVADRAFRMQAEAGWKNEDCTYIVDATGIGQSAMIKYEKARKNLYEFHNGGKATNKAYDNKVTEAWFHLARLAKARKLHIPNDNRLIQQLSTRLYDIDEETGKIYIEDKDTYITRLRKEHNTDVDDSPDRADALVMCFYEHTIADSQMSSGATSSGRVGIGAEVEASY